MQSDKRSDETSISLGAPATDNSLLMQVSYTSKNSFLANAKTLAGNIWRESSIRKEAVAALVTCVVVSMQLATGFSSESLALQAASYRLLADALAMITAIVAIFNSKRASNFNFSYGFERLQTLLWFANAVLMLFISLFIFEGVVETLLLGGEIEPRAGLVWMGILGLANSVALFVLFPQHLAFQGSSLAGATIVSNILVLVTAWAARYENGEIVDVFSSCAVGAMIIYSSWPVFIQSGLILLQTTPMTLKGRLDKCLREASAFEGILECTREHFWELAPGTCFGSVHFRVRANANEQAVLQHVQKCFATNPPILAGLTVQIEKEDWNIH